MAEADNPSSTWSPPQDLVEEINSYRKNIESAGNIKELRGQKRSFSSKYHPDKHLQASEAERNFYEATFKELNNKADKRQQQLESPSANKTESAWSAEKERAKKERAARAAYAEYVRQHTAAHNQSASNTNDPNGSPNRPNYASMHDDPKQDATPKNHAEQAWQKIKKGVENIDRDKEVAEQILRAVSMLSAQGLLDPAMAAVIEEMLKKREKRSKIKFKTTAKEQRPQGSIAAPQPSGASGRNPVEDFWSQANTSGASSGGAASKPSNANGYTAFVGNVYVDGEPKGEGLVVITNQYNPSNRVNNNGQVNQSSHNDNGSGNKPGAAATGNKETTSPKTPQQRGLTPGGGMSAPAA